MPIDPRMRLMTPRLLLRATLPSDAARLADIQANWNVTRMLRLAQWPVDRMAIAAWVAGHDAEWAAGTGYRFAIVLDGEVVGLCDLDSIKDTTGDLGYWIDEAHWGKGLVSEAAAAVVDFGFDALGLTSITSGHAIDNPGSGRVLLKLSFMPVQEVIKFNAPRGCDVLNRTYILKPPAWAARAPALRR